jgi:hypothetical protein
MNVSAGKALLGLAFALGLAATAHSQAAWEFTSAGNAFTNGSWDFATAFTANSAVTVSGLGYYADPTNGQVDANQVALYQCSNAGCTGTGSLIASATVTNTYALNGHFRYVTVAPVTLVAGDSYEVAGVSHSDYYTWDDSGFKVNSGISLIALNGTTDRWNTGAGATAPDFLNYGQDDIGSEDGFWGPNVYLGSASGFTGTTAAPEINPAAAASALMLLLGGIAILRGRRSLTA